MKSKNIILIIAFIISLVGKPIKSTPVNKSNHEENSNDINSIYDTNKGGANYFHISSNKEFGVTRQLTRLENKNLQQTCGYVKKNHLKPDETPEVYNDVKISKRNDLNGSDFDGRDGFNAIAYAKGKVPDGSAPWAVAIGFDNSATCSGTIISKYHILTAAHCLFIYETPTTNCVGIKNLVLTKDIRIYYGGTCLKKSVDNLCKQRNVKEKGIRRASYNYKYHLNFCSYGSDIAILEVDSPFEFDEMTQPICMPPYSFNEKLHIKDKEIIHTIGYGKTELNMTSVFLRRGQSVICKDGVHFDKATDTFANGLICLKSCTPADNVDCHGYDGLRTGVCKGDSGGADYMRMNDVSNSNDQRYMIIGVHSSGSECTPKELSNEVFHHSGKVSFYGKEICWLTGICPQDAE